VVEKSYYCPPLKGVDEEMDRGYLASEWKALTVRTLCSFCTILTVWTAQTSGAALMEDVVSCVQNGHHESDFGGTSKETVTQLGGQNEVEKTVR
jgi:hypothetical protein